MVSASGRRMGLVTTIGVSGWPARTMVRKARVCSRNIAVENGMRLQQLVPCEIEMTAASSAASCSAETISPCADPA